MYAVNPTSDPITIRYAIAIHAFAETAAAWNLAGSPNATATTASIAPPTSICAPALSTFDEGSGSLRVITDATDQKIDAAINASAPTVLIGALPRWNEWLISTATPHSPTISAAASLTVIRRARSSRISAIAMNTGIVAIITPATPEATFCSAQNNSP